MYAIVGVLIAGFVWTSIQVKRQELEGSTLFGPAKNRINVARETPLTGRKAPAFTLKSLKGEQVSLSDFKGQVVLIDFFATWCPPCRAVTPILRELETKYKDKGLTVISIDQGEPREMAADYAKEMGYTALMLVDEDGSVSERYKVTGLPTLVIIDQNGKVSSYQVGFAPQAMDKLEGQICKLLGIKFEPQYQGGPHVRH